MIDQSSITKIKLSKGVYVRYAYTPKAFRPYVLLATTHYYLDRGTIFGILLCVTNLAILLLLKLNHRAEPWFWHWKIHLLAKGFPFHFLISARTSACNQDDSQFPFILSWRTIASCYYTSKRSGHKKLNGLREVEKNMEWKSAGILLSLPNTAVFWTLA